MSKDPPKVYAKFIKLFVDDLEQAIEAEPNMCRKTVARMMRKIREKLGLPTKP